MRESSYRVTWTPVDGTSRVLVAWGDVLTREIDPRVVLGTDARRVFRRGGAMVAGRGNSKRTFTVEVVREHATHAARWQALADAAAADEWGVKGILDIYSSQGVPRAQTACLLESSHHLHGEQRTRHRYVFRCAEGLADAGDAVSIVAGGFNPPTTEFPGGTIRVTLPPGSGPGGNDFEVGDWIELGGVVGLPGGGGTFQVVDVSGGGLSDQEVTVAGKHDQPDPIKPAPGGVNSNRNANNVFCRFQGLLYVYGCDAFGSGYEVEVVQEAARTYRGNFTPDGLGEKVIDLDALFGLPNRMVSRIRYEDFRYGSAGGPQLIANGGTFPLNGISIPMPDGPSGPGTIVQSGPTGFTVRLYKDAALLDEQTIEPQWETTVNVATGPSNIYIDAPDEIRFLLQGDGGSRTQNAGVPALISGGTATAKEAEA